MFWKTASDRSCFVAAAAQLSEKPHAALWRRVTHECTVTFTPLTYHEALIRSKHAVLKNVKFPKQKCPVGHLSAVCIVKAPIVFLQISSQVYTLLYLATFHAILSSSSSLGPSVDDGMSLQITSFSA